MAPAENYNVKHLTSGNRSSQADGLSLFTACALAADKGVAGICPLSEPEADAKDAGDDGVGSSATARLSTYNKQCIQLWYMIPQRYCQADKIHYEMRYGEVSLVR